MSKTITKHKSEADSAPFGAITTKEDGLATNSSTWSGVTAEDIGAHFQAVDFDEVFGDTRLKTLKVRSFKNKFIKGRSPFITYTFKVKVHKAKSTKPKPINENTKLTRSVKSKFVANLGDEIKALRDLFVSELLPVSLAIQSASEEVKDLTAQLVDEPVTIPVDFIRLKALQAIQLRVSRHMADRLKLTPAEAVQVYPEFIRILDGANREKV